MSDAYAGREQTEAKHFILRHYLQELALITFQAGYPTLTYVDGFSGPWQSREPDFSDTSFMIAIEVLKDVQKRLAARGMKRTVKCFFVEKSTTAFAELDPAVREHHNPGFGFYVDTFEGRFEDAIPAIISFAEGFSLTFIDPTGWTEYGFDKIGPILNRVPGEVLVNFMYDHISRFSRWDDPAIVASFNGILRPGWRDRINMSLPPGEAALKLFRREFKEVGGFDYVISTPIKKLEERIHFCITYGTRHPKGVEVYRGVEYKALREHDFRRFESQLMKLTTGDQAYLFTASDLHQKRTMEAQSAAEKEEAANWLEEILRTSGRSYLFEDIWPEMLECYALKKSEAKDVIVELADRGIIQRTWRVPGSKRRKPNEGDLIALAVTSNNDSPSRS